MQKLEKSILNRMQACKDCSGACYYTKPGSDKKSRCKSCFEDDLFLFRFRTAKLNESYIDPQVSKKIREKFHRNYTVFTTSLNPNTQNTYAHSAGFFATRYLYKTEIFSDIDIIDTVFNNAGVKEGTAQLAKFLEPQFAVFFLGKTLNRKFIGAHIMNILREREMNFKFSFLVLPSVESVKQAYEYEEIEHYLKDLSDRGAVV